MTATCAVDGCTGTAFIKHPLPLCQRDALMVSLNVTDVLHANALAGTMPTGLDIDIARVAPPGVWALPSHPPVVYFLVNGDRVKIGTSTNVTARVGALSLRRSNAQLLLEGGKGLEDALHDHFQADRIGRTEWFVLSAGIRDYIARRIQADVTLRQPVLPAEPELEEEPQKPPRRIVMPVTSPRPPSADDKILKALAGVADPIGLESIYLDKDAITRLTSVEASTLDNALSRLSKAGKIHRQIKDGKEVRGMYAHGPHPIAPDTQEDEDEAA